MATYESLLSGPWIEFEDEHGSGYAQPDHLVFGPGWAIIFECKLGWTPAAVVELQTLYAPLVDIDNIAKDEHLFLNLSCEIRVLDLYGGENLQLGGTVYPI